MNGPSAWGDAAWAAALLWVDPQGLGGVRLRAGAGPVRDAWLRIVEAMRPEGAPLRRMPASIGDERLIGGLDLAATLRAGRPGAQRGLLAECDGGVLIVAMAERLEPSAAARLGAVLDTGEVLLERDGLAERIAARIGIVALDEGQGDDEHPPPALVERLALHIDLTEIALGDVDDAPFERAEIVEARERCAAVVVDASIVEALCGATLALGVDSPRAALFALRATRAVAALGGRAQASADDAAVATRLVLAARATQLPPAESHDEAPPEPEPESEPDDTPPPGDAQQDETSVDTLEDRLVEAAQAALSAELLLRLQAADAARSRSRSVGRSGATSASRWRGRPVGARRGMPGGGVRLDLLETLRAAAPWQRLRGASRGHIAVRSDDFRIQRFKQRRSTTTVFVIDASGSSALHRLAEAKGAVELLLAECYVRRDEVAVIGFRGRGAELLLPPTRSLVRAKRCLAGLPGGGGTPLAAGIDAAAALADAVRRRGASPLVVLLTDGRANIGRDGSPGRARAEQDAIGAARALREIGRALLIDTSAQPEPAARRLADAMGASYLALPRADAQALARGVRVLANGA